MKSATGKLQLELRLLLPVMTFGFLSPTSLLYSSCVSRFCGSYMVVFEQRKQVVNWYILQLILSLPIFEDGFV